MSTTKVHAIAVSNINLELPLCKIDDVVLDYEKIAYTILLPYQHNTAENGLYRTAPNGMLIRMNVDRGAIFEAVEGAVNQGRSFVVTSDALFGEPVNISEFAPHDDIVNELDAANQRINNLTREIADINVDKRRLANINTELRSRLESRGLSPETRGEAVIRLERELTEARVERAKLLASIHNLQQQCDLLRGQRDFHARRATAKAPKNKKYAKALRKIAKKMEGR